jgi:PhnB protein
MPPRKPSSRSAASRQRSKTTGKRRRRPATAAKIRRVAAEGHAVRRAGAGSGLAPGMQAVNPYLAVANVAATMEFMERALGFARGVVLPDAAGQLRYAEMRHGDSVVMLVRKGDEATATGGAAALYAYVQDVDDALMRAREAGAGVNDAEDRPWGDRAAVVTDPDGYKWVLATFKKLAPFS